MTRHRPVFNRRRPLTDGDEIRDLPSSIAVPARLFGAADRALGSKGLKKLFLKHTAGLNK